MEMKPKLEMGTKNTLITGALYSVVTLVFFLAKITGLAL